MDKFFSQHHCDRCGGSLKAGRIMSMYSAECLCLACKEAERKRDDYQEALAADHREIRKGNYNYQGIREEKESE